MGTALDLVGQRYGMLTVRRRIQLTPERPVHWICDCDCGWSCVKSVTQLRRRNVKPLNCGCMNGWLPDCIPNLVGKKFESLTVVSYSHSGKGQAYWNCECECGKTVIRKSVELNTGLAMSCGCRRVVSSQAASRQYVVYNTQKQNAIKRGLVWSLSKSDVAGLVAMPCHYCGLSPDPINGIDRVDNSRGYEADNVVPCCRKCNRAKDVYSVSEFKHWIKRAYEHMCLGVYGDPEERSEQSLSRDDRKWHRHLSTCDAARKRSGLIVE